MCVLYVIYFTCKWEPYNPFHTCTRIKVGGPFIPLSFSYVCKHPFHFLSPSRKFKQDKRGKNREEWAVFYSLFVDDSLLFFRKDKGSLENIMKSLDWYCKLLSKKINLSKSDLYCSPNMHESDQNSLARLLQVNLVQNPSKYLGLDFKLRGNRVADFQFLIDKLNSKLQGWKAKLLSQAGRTTLISSVLQSLPLYCFRMPESICNKMDSIVRAFWWGHELGEHKLHLIKWDQLCQPKRNGGLGIKKFSLMNQAMLAKQYWRIT